MTLRPMASLAGAERDLLRGDEPDDERLGHDDLPPDVGTRHYEPI